MVVSTLYMKMKLYTPKHMGELNCEQAMAEECNMKKIEGDNLL